MSIQKALLWVGIWVGLALLFNAGIYYWAGPEKALQFFGGYIIEQSLSMDNLFLFLLVFSSFGIPSAYQRRVLNYGIMGAVVLRLIFVMLGVAVVNRFHWILYLFGILLLISGFKMFFSSGETADYKDNFLLKLLGKMIPITRELEGQRFFIRKNNVLFATPLLAVLVLIEGSDIIFAVDSIPAIFSITTDPFIVFTSNIFAIMGLRSMYFILEKLHNAFRFVKYGVALILVFTGIKLTALMFHVEISLALSIAVIFTILGVSIGLSVVLKPKIPA